MLAALVFTAELVLIGTLLCMRAMWAATGACVFFGAVANWGICHLAHTALQLLPRQQTYQHGLSLFDVCGEPAVDMQVAARKALDWCGVP